jgi:hypothetical protein
MCDHVCACEYAHVLVRVNAYARAYTHKRIHSHTYLDCLSDSLLKWTIECGKKNIKVLVYQGLGISRSWYVCMHAYLFAPSRTHARTHTHTSEEFVGSIMAHKRGP